LSGFADLAECSDRPGTVIRSRFADADFAARLFFQVRCKACRFRAGTLMQDKFRWSVAQVPYLVHFIIWRNNRPISRFTLYRRVIGDVDIYFDVLRHVFVHVLPGAFGRLGLAVFDRTNTARPA
jgi:hypothetical protein